MQQADFSTKVSPMVSPVTKKGATPGMGCNVFISGWVWYLYFPEAKTISTLKIGVEMKSRAQKVISVLALVGVGAGIKGIHRTTSTFHNCFTSQSTLLQRWDSNQHLCEKARSLRPLISEISAPQLPHRIIIG